MALKAVCSRENREQLNNVISTTVAIDLRKIKNVIW